MLTVRKLDDLFQSRASNTSIWLKRLLWTASPQRLSIILLPKHFGHTRGSYGGLYLELDML